MRAWRLAATLTAMRLTLEDVCGALWDYRPPSEIGRHELTNEQWLLIRELFPKPETRRGSPRHPRRLLDGMFWTLRTGVPWRDLPRERYGSWQTVWRRFDQWRRVIDLAIIQRLLRVAVSGASLLRKKAGRTPPVISATSPRGGGGLVGGMRAEVLEERLRSDT